MELPSVTGPVLAVGDARAFDLEPDSVSTAVEAVPDAAAALAFVEATDVACVVSPVALPDSDGESFLNALRARSPTLPVCLTPTDETLDRARALAADPLVDAVRRDEPDAASLVAARIETLLAASRGIDEPSDSDGATAERRPDREAELRRSTRRFEAIFDDPNLFIALLEPDGTIRNVNRTATETFGIPPEAVVGDRFSTAPWWGPERASTVEDWIDRAADGDYVEYQDDHPVDHENAIPVEGVFRPVTDEAGDVVSIVVSARDVSERRARTRELERQNERLDRFARIVSHDLRNPLTVASGHLDLVAQECASEHLAEIEHAHERMRRLVDDILTLSRAGQSAMEPAAVSLRDVAERSWRHVATPEATLAVETQASIPADEGLLGQLFENLFRNAVEHAGPTVSVAVETLDRDGAVHGFAVVDDGPGIPAADRDDVFASGYTTSEDGTGYGLEIVSEIVRSHGWEVSVTDAADAGARFEIRTSP